MAQDTPFYGYNGAVWACCYASFNFLADTISQNAPLDQVEQIATTVYNTCLNGLSCINGNTTIQAWQAELISLQAVQAIPVSVPAAVVSALNNRVSALAAAITAYQAVVPSIPPVNIQSVISQNLTPVPTCDTLSFYDNFNYETPPLGTTDANLILASQTLAFNFDVLATAIAGYQGAMTTPAYDAANRLARTSAFVANNLLSLTSGPLSDSIDVTTNWNQIVTLPSLLMEGYLLSTPPYYLAVQQQEVIRFVILMMVQQLALFLTILRKPITTQVNLATLLQGDSLMDVAARNLGDFEQWAQIAITNNLYPPYVGPVSEPNIAAWGGQLVLPSQSTGQSAIGSVPNYAINFLGTDLYVGPINGDMPPWQGDFQTITGYSNLRWALGRRLQTTLGQLIYHSNYGSRIPPEVGNIQTNATASLINAFGISALLSDPRVQEVIGSTTQLLPNFAVAFNAAVRPAGFGAARIGVNEVLGPS